MDFYCISKPDNKSVREFIIKACKDRSINYIELDPSTNKLDILEYPKPQKGDALYRVVANSINSKKVEYELAREGVATFYSSRDVIFRPTSALKLNNSKEIPTPETITVLTSNRIILKKHAEHLGLPLIIKSLGGKEGVGVMRIDSLQSLFSVSDYLYKQSGNYILRKFINNKESLRLIVLGDKVISSIKYMTSNEDDFRSNRRTGFDGMEVCKCTDEIEKIAIDAVRAMGLEFAGVDILVDEDGKPYVLEANFPCNFGDAQIMTGIDIAGLMIDYLLEKSQKLKG